jgi:hypothetical protein
MSFNSPKGEQFIKRTANYSTHGSRRGFVDDGTYVESKNTDRKALARHIDFINKQIHAFREKYKVPYGKNISQLFRKGKTRARIPVDTYNAMCELIKHKNELQEELLSIPKGANQFLVNQEMLKIYKETYEVSDETHHAIKAEAFKRLEAIKESNEKN